ncbi:MAG: twin-arginine translocase TatA/TatE family subunit [Verrucomicrobia bacterium]|nr:twin-arginine translocase TatA/TatE family subunit [Verrucomicrobiota bacterium]MCH8512859.1 twin-arginine translocase TatA/TatE family subunit [Kiritimatiellia bacterium]
MYNPFSFAFVNAMGSPLEMAVIILAVLLMFGAKSLPGTLRTLGRWMEQLRQISRDVQREIIGAEKPFEDARRAWENEVRDLTVSSSSRRPPPLEEAEEITNEQTSPDPEDTEKSAAKPKADPPTAEKGGDIHGT